MMDLPEFELLKRRENVYCRRNIRNIRMESVEKWSPALPLQQQQHQSKCSQHTMRNHFATSARSRTKATVLLLYISYTLSIHLLWTNCVIFTETAQLNLNRNSSWNSLLHHHQQQPEQPKQQQYQQNRTESNRNLNSNNSHQNLKSNLVGNASSHSHCICGKFNGISNESTANQFEFSTNFPILSMSSRKFASSSSSSSSSSSLQSSSSIAVQATKTPKAINVNRIAAASDQMVSRSRRQAKHIHIINQLKRTTSLGRQFKINQLQPSSSSTAIPLPPPSPPPQSILATTIYNTPPFDADEHNEFRQLRTQISDRISFRKYQSERDNVIKSVKIHAIKRNVNTFTSAIGHNSNLPVINAITGIHSETIESSTMTMATATARTTTTAAAGTMPVDLKSISSVNDDAIANIPIALAIHQNQTVTGDSKQKTNNSSSSSSAINRMENNRENNRSPMSSSSRTILDITSITAASIPITRTPSPSPPPTTQEAKAKVKAITVNTITTTTPTTMAETKNPIPKQTSFNSPATNRFRVNDVFEMDTKRKFFNASYRQNKDNANDSNHITSMDGDGDGLNKWHVEQQHRQQLYQNGKRIISLLGLFELSTRNGLRRAEGQSELAAAELAVQHINKRDHLLSGYTLQLITNDTKCDPGVGVDRFFHAVYTKRLTRVQMLLGSACSEVTESLAKVVPHWNIVQVSFGSTSPALSDRSEFPLFYRTVAPDSSHNPARIAFIRRFGWDTVTTFSQNEEIHSLAVNDLVTELENANISCTATTFAETDFKYQLKMLRDLDTRIIIGSFSHDLAPKIFCEAYKLGMYGADYVWILHEIVGEPWWHKTTYECSQKQLQEVSENLLIVSSHNSIVSNEISYSGLTYSMFVDELNSRLNVSKPPPLSRYAAQTYDAVWAMALSLNGAEIKWEQWKQNNSSTIQPQLDHFDYTRYDMALEFFHQFSRLNFLGVSGPVSFSGADRVGISVFSQVQDGRLQSVALFHPSQLHLDFDCVKCVPIKWKNGQVPIAKRVFKLRVATVSPIAFSIVSTLALIGIILSIAFVAFNLHFRKLKTIKLSSPKLSNITAFGCILVYAAVILLGLDHSTLPANEKAFPVVCTARVYLLSSGFSLAFGSMFAKTYRVHRIFTRSGSSVCKDKMLQDAQLISLVCALLLLDGLVLTLWVVFDPMERHLSNLTLEISLTDRSVVYQPQVEVCRSQHTQTWLGALYIFKGLLLVVGVYMAWETRHVKIPALNDSQYIGVSVYSVVITSAIVVVLANLISERVTLAFLTITALILTSTTATLCLLFLPKMQDIWGQGVINDPVIHSMGLKMECNTRRFMIDDKRELQYRVEVQNRVYKKELAALDIEIGKLEKLLETPSSTSSSDLSIPRLIKHELAVVNEENEKSASSKHKQQRTPSIGGGLPLLLLSVLPPVIPRASWPSADVSSNTMRKSVTFSSQPQLEDESSVARLPAIDLLHLRLTHQQATADARKGLIDRIIGFFGSKPPSRKASTSSIAGGSSGLVGAALKVHMGLFSNIVPSASSCNAIDGAGIRPLRKMSIARSGTAINTRCSSITYEPSFRERSGNFPASLPPFVISMETDSANASRKNIFIDTEHEPKVNFQLPLDRRASILNQQPTLRDRVKGSPRFPHRIAPTSSLNALVESSEITAGAAGSSKSKWKSMEDSTMFASSSTSFNTTNC